MPRVTDAKFDFERLDVFSAALDAVALLDELAGALPRGRAYMRDQLRRASNSIVLNIAEGAGEFLPGEKGRIYRIARRSATECAGQLMIARRLRLLDADAIMAALDQLRLVLVMLVRLIQVCRRRESALNGPPP